MEYPAAEPLLASDILLKELSDHKKLQESTAPDQPAKLPTGIKSIDQAFEGGFNYGQVHCITSQPDHVAQRGLIQALLEAHLLSSPNATATVIDSTMAFDVRQLYQSVEHTLLLRGSDNNASEAALQVLKRLKLSQVFDFVGLTETMADLHDGGGSILETTTAHTGEVAQKPPRGTVGDSEDEEDLLDDLSAAKEVVPAVAPPELHPTNGLLIIDNLSQLMAPLSKNSYAQGQAMLSSLMRSLGHLTRRNALCTFVLANASPKPAGEGEGLSMFRSCTIRPALGNGIGYLVDVHMYLHEIPRRSGTGGGQGSGSGKTAESASVLEIVQDRYGSRFGRWAPFLCDADGRLVDIP